MLTLIIKANRIIILRQGISMNVSETTQELEPENISKFRRYCSCGYFPSSNIHYKVSHHEVSLKQEVEGDGEVIVKSSKPMPRL